MERILIVGLTFIWFGGNFAQVQPTEQYFLIGENLQLRPPSGISTIITRVQWRHNDNIVAEWSEGDAKVDTYGDFKDRTDLDTSTGILRIRNMTKAEAGEYTIEINNIRLDVKYVVKSIKAVPEPNVWVKPKNKVENQRECACEGNVEGAEPVTYLWNTGPGCGFYHGREHTVTQQTVQISRRFFELCFVERDVLWASKTRKHSETTVQERISLMGSISTDAQSSQQIVSQLCSGLGSSTAQQLSAQARQLNQSLRSLQERRSEESVVLQEDQAQMQQRVEKTRSLVKSFLREELQRDVSTGATPQRREFEFPQQLVKGRSRAELLECLRNQQEALRAALEEEEEGEEEEEEEHSQDSLEDEPSTCNESLATEPSFIDENLVFNESRRLPFFKKKGKRKQTKIPSRPKAAEMESTPKKSSRLPLRCQN